MDVVVRNKGQFTIPAPVREQVNVEAGDRFDVSVRGGCIILEPISNGSGNGNGRPTADELPPEWAARIERSIGELDARMGRVFETDDAFLASFDD